MCPNRSKFRSLILGSGVALLLAAASAAQGQGRLDLSPLIAKVKPSVVLIQVVEKGRVLGNGSGFVVDPKGLIATNYHVVEGAKGLVVSFPADKDKAAFPVKGFIGILPGKDMALVMIDPKDKKLPVLPLAKELPSQGEPVVAFGAPLGFSDTVTDGIVSAVRTGTELSEMLSHGGHNEYKEHLGYDLDIQWLQTSAPISPGNSGGPLVNARGEAVGINTFVSQVGQNLNFSLSTTHLREFIAKAGSTVQPLSSLPPPRVKHMQPTLEMGDPATTFSIWKQFNRAKIALDAKVAEMEGDSSKHPRSRSSESEKRTEHPQQESRQAIQADRKELFRVCEEARLAKNEKADVELIKTMLREANAAQKASSAYQELASVIVTQGSSRAPELATAELKEHLADLRTEYDLLRVNLSRKYQKTYPTLEDTAKEGDSASNDDDTKKDDADAGGGHKGGSVDPEERSVMRTWTDSSGQHHVDAKFLGMEDGKAKLQEPTAGSCTYRPASLSEADRRFIGEE